jgi:glycerophosphoryl diester phosphodiesterase
VRLGVAQAALVALVALGCAQSSRDRTPQRVNDEVKETDAVQDRSGWKALQGQWQVSEGSLSVDAKGGEARIAAPGGPWSSVRIDVDVTVREAPSPEAWIAVELGADALTVTPHHRVLVRPHASARRGIEYSARDAGGRWHLRGSATLERPPTVGETHRLAIACGGGRLQVLLDGELRLESFLAGDLRPGLVVLDASGLEGSFSDFAARSLRAEEREAMRLDLGPVRRIPAIAHRGASAEAPENTLAALRLGVERGADGVEFDVCRSRDGALVIFHDKTLPRTTDFQSVFPGRDGKEAELSAFDLADLRRLDAGSWKSPRFAGERIPTLEEALEVLRGRAMAVVEIKPAEIGREVARTIQRLGLEEQVFVISFAAEAVREARAELPGAATGFLTHEHVSVDPVARARKHLKQAREAGANAIVCEYPLASPEYIRDLHRHAMAVWVYTVDEPEVMEVLIRAGIDGIISNVPERLLALLAAAGTGAPRAPAPPGSPASGR